jgi:plasmid stabilization system protein ParE
VSRVIVAPSARDDLEALVKSHSLPADTTRRVRRSLERPARFPRLGRRIEEGRWVDYRFVLGPWRWMIVLYKYDDQADEVMVASFEDGRSSRAAVRR